MKPVNRKLGRVFVRKPREGTKEKTHENFRRHGADQPDARDQRLETDAERMIRPSPVSRMQPKVCSMPRQVTENLLSRDHPIRARKLDDETAPTDQVS